MLPNYDLSAFWSYSSVSSVLLIAYDINICKCIQIGYKTGQFHDVGLWTSSVCNQMTREHCLEVLRTLI